jgi:hypothetical protein
VPADWSLSGNENGGDAILLGFSFQGSTIQAGNGRIATVYLEPMDMEFTAELCFSDYVLSNPQAESYFTFATCADAMNPFEEPIILSAVASDWQPHIALNWNAYEYSNSNLNSRDEVDLQITGYANGLVEVSMTNTEAVAGFQFDIDAGDGLSNLNVSGVGSGGSATDAGFTVSTNTSGLVLGFSFSGASIPAGSGVLCYVEAMFDGDAGTLSVSSATMSDTGGSSLTVDLGSDYWIGDMEIYGCMDSGADNYNPEATMDDGNCEYWGCTDPNADNYDMGANVDDGTCTYPPASYTIWRDGEVLMSGFEDTHYEDWGVDYGSTYCYVVEAVDMGIVLATSNEACATTMDLAGCMDPDATNYNEDANIDDGSCVYFELSYFTDLPDQTGESSLVIIQNAMDLEPGDEVGLFDAAGVVESVDAGETPEYGYTLVGAGVWTGDQLEIVGVESVDLSDFNGPVLNGYVAGNPIVYKVWKAADNTEYNANVEYQVGSGDWGAILTVVSMLEPVFSVTQELDLDPYTFNMASFNVTPENGSVSSIFGDLSLLLVKNDDSEYYVPDFGVDQIDEVSVGEGYKVFLTGGGSQSFSVEGMAIDLSTMLSLESYTFNMLGYLPQDCMATSEVFAGYEDSILLVKNDASDYYVPAFGVTTLDEMCPGEAYAVFLNGGGGLDFMYPSGMASLSDDLRDINDDYKAQTRRDDVAVTGESHLVILDGISGEVQEGDILRAYANNELVGSINIIDEHLMGIRPIDLVAHGSVDLSAYDGPVLHGYDEGDRIELRLFSIEDQGELKVISTLDYDTYATAIDADGDEIRIPMSFGSVEVRNESAIPTDFRLTQNYPNPFNPTTTIDYNVASTGFVSLKVYDVMGRLVKTLVDNQWTVAGQTSGYSVMWNGLDDGGQKVSAGLYIYRLQSGSMSTSNKMILLK